MMLLLLLFAKLVIAQRNVISKSELDSLPFIVVDKMPEFPGGNDSLLKFIGQNLRYPAIKMDDPEGIVWVKFIVERNGKISNAEIERGLGEYYDKEVLRLVNSMPLWTVGEKNNVAVRTVNVLPVQFTLR